MGKSYQFIIQQKNKQEICTRKKAENQDDKNNSCETWSLFFNFLLPQEW